MFHSKCCVATLLALCIFAASPSGVLGQDRAIVEPPKDPAGYRLLESQIKTVVAKVLPAVVGIQVGQASGSGVIVSADGIVMTAGHVVGQSGRPVLFHFADGKTAKGTTLGTHAASDAGLMKITDAGKWPFVALGHSRDVKQGMWCLALGHPLGYRPGRPPVVRVGRVLRTGEGMVQTDCPLVSGDSGGPLLDLAGNVIGINSRIGQSTEYNLHVAVDVFREEWDRMLKGESLPPDAPSRNSPRVRGAFRQVVHVANQCVVRVKCDGKDAALGTIVGPDGWVLTKASELKLKGRITCRLRDGRELEAHGARVYGRLDLAMLKIDAVDLPAIPWSQAQPAVGRWLVSAGMDDDPVALGIVSVPCRAVPPIGGAVGVMLSDGVGAPQVSEVLPHSPAEAAGLKPGDVITHVDGEPVANKAVGRALIQRHHPEETITLTVKRGRETLKVPVVLKELDTPAIRQQRAINSMGVGVSRRSDDFPLVIQHDTVLRPIDCGGPVVDLDGGVVGINIAHGGRTETYCLPTESLFVPMYEMMSGLLSARQAAERQKAVDEKAAEEKPPSKGRYRGRRGRKGARGEGRREKRARGKAARRKTAAQRGGTGKTAAPQRSGWRALIRVARPCAAKGVARGESIRFAGGSRTCPPRKQGPATSATQPVTTCRSTGDTMSESTLSRRRFLEGAALAAAAPMVVPSTALGLGTATAASERVTLAHIGVGGRGYSVLTFFLQRCRGSQSVAVADAYKDRREACARMIRGKAYRDFRDILARPDIDAVVVATPDHWHVPIAIAAARAKKDAYVEKPLGVSIEQDLACLKAFTENSRVFQYGTMQRSMDHCRFGCELVRSGRIGKVHTIEVIAPNGGAGGSTKVGARAAEPGL